MNVAYVRISLIGAKSSYSYFQIDGFGRYAMCDGIVFTVPEGLHTLQAVQVVYDAFSTADEEGETCIPFSITTTFHTNSVIELRVFLHTDGCIIDMECNQADVFAREVQINKMQG